MKKNFLLLNELKFSDQAILIMAGKHLPLSKPSAYKNICICLVQIVVFDCSGRVNSMSSSLAPLASRQSAVISRTLSITAGPISYKIFQSFINNNDNITKISIQNKTATFAFTSKWEVFKKTMKIEKRLKKRTVSFLILRNVVSFSLVDPI